MAMVTECHSPSLKDKLRSSICCFRGNPHELLENEEDRQRTPGRSLQSVDQELDIRYRLRELIGRRRGKNSRRFNSSDFRYDPTSYALNFEDESCIDELPLADFSSRLPMTPDNAPAKDLVKVPVSRSEIVAWN